MRQRKIPTLLGIFMVAIAVVLFRYAFNAITPLLTKADTANAPQAVTVSNVSDTSFTVTWLTKRSTNGSLLIENGITKMTAYDDRDALAQNPSVQSSYVTHSVSVRNLKADTTYSVRIMVDRTAHLQNGKPYEIRTAPAISGTGITLEPAYGQITLSDGSPADGAIVYLTPEGGQTLSAMVKSSGSWVVPLNLVRTTSFDRYLPAKDRINESITVNSADGTATAITDTLNDNPVPQMTIGKTYDFRKIQAEAQPQKQVAMAASPTTAPQVLGATKQYAVAITKPLQDQALTSNLPLIQGTGIPGANVSLIVGITNPTGGNAVVGNDGVWYFTPSKPLSDGKQSVTVTTTGANGKAVAITRSFTVLKSGTQVLGDATPSATLTPTATILPTPTTESTVSATPTVSLAGQPIPTTGNELPLLMLLLAGIMVFTGGAYLFIR